MKHIILSFSILFLFAACSSAVKLKSTTYTHSEDFTFELERYDFTNMITASDTRYFTDQSEQFMSIYLSISNKTNKELKLNLEDFLLYEPDGKNWLPPEKIISRSAIKFYKKPLQTFEPEEEKSFRLIYLIPADVLPNRMQVKGREIELQPAK